MNDNQHVVGQPSKVVLITGASSGIGRETALKFARNGWRVAATMRDLGKSPWATPSGRIVPMRLDVTDASSIQSALSACQRTLGPIDAVVNNAGYALMGPVEALDAASIRRQLDTNLIGAIELMRAVLPSMRQRRTGVIVNVSSIGGRIAFPFAAAYHASKFALEGLTESMRFELQRHGIRVRLVEPGGIKTKFIENNVWRSAPAYEPEVSNFQHMALRLNEGLPSPDRVADVIYQAAVDPGQRLRYVAAPGPYLALHALLPDGIWRRIVGAALSRHAGSQKPPSVARTTD